VRSRYVVAAVMLLLLALVAGCGSGGSGSHYCTASVTKGCEQVPTSATKEDFCAAGAMFSESKGFKNGLKAAAHLAAVGTPADIKESARAGFVELVERMIDSSDGADFRRRTHDLRQDSKASKHLLDLDTYIQEAC
jgi:hypothetical protein